jgi:GTP pyrophosphokinase
MTLSQRFEEALVFAKKLHASQYRKGNQVPYIAHLLAVAAIVLENGGNEDEAIAALLHDAIEDQGGAATREKIRRRFGDEITAIVDGCTDADSNPKPPWKERKKAYLEKLPSASSSVILVSAADKLHNARTILNDYRLIGEKVWSRFTGGKKDTMWYYREVVKILKNVGGPPVIGELERTVDELEELSKGSEK